MNRNVAGLAESVTEELFAVSAVHADQAAITAGSRINICKDQSETVDGRGDVRAGDDEMDFHHMRVPWDEKSLCAKRLKYRRIGRIHIPAPPRSVRNWSTIDCRPAVYAPDPCRTTRAAFAGITADKNTMLLKTVYTVLHKLDSPDNLTVPFFILLLISVKRSVRHNRMFCPSSMRK